MIYPEKITETYTFVLEMEVRDYELDSEKIVNNANYLHYMEHTRHKFCESIGVPFMELVDRNLIVVVRNIDIEYFTPLKSGERFLSCLNMRRNGAKFVFQQDIFKPDGSKVAFAKIAVVALKDGKLSRGDEIASLFYSALS